MFRELILIITYWNFRDLSQASEGNVFSCPFCYPQNQTEQYRDNSKERLIPMLSSLGLGMLLWFSLGCRFFFFQVRFLFLRDCIHFLSLAHALGWTIMANQSAKKKTFKGKPAFNDNDVGDDASSQSIDPPPWAWTSIDLRFSHLSNEQDNSIYLEGFLLNE